VASAAAGIATATTAPSRTSTSRAPGTAISDQSAVSSTRVNPASSSRLRTSAAAWYELGAAVTKAARSSM